MPKPGASGSRQLLWRHGNPWGGTPEACNSLSPSIGQGDWVAVKELKLSCHQEEHYPVVSHTSPITMVTLVKLLNSNPEFGLSSAGTTEALGSVPFEPPLWDVFTAVECLGTQSFWDPHACLVEHRRVIRCCRSQDAGRLRFLGLTLCSRRKVRAQWLWLGVGVGLSLRAIIDLGSILQ